MTTEELALELEKWPPLRERGGAEFGAARQYLGRVANRQLSDADLREVCAVLERRGVLVRADPKMQLTELDRPERALYAKLMAAMRPFIAQTFALTDQHVFVESSSAGARGDGAYTIPDFTLATIRTWRFDPRPSLDVYSFEVKNRAGATVDAVYEARAHARMVHYPYLVAPRSAYWPQDHQSLAEAAIHEGVGLILFDLVAASDGDFQVQGLERVVEAERRDPDPARVERHLTRRLSTDDQTRLLAFATDARRGEASAP